MSKSGSIEMLSMDRIRSPMVRSPLSVLPAELSCIRDTNIPVKVIIVWSKILSKLVSWDRT